MSPSEIEYARRIVRGRHAFRPAGGPNHDTEIIPVVRIAMPQRRAMVLPEPWPGPRRLPIVTVAVAPNITLLQRLTGRVPGARHAR